MTIWIRRLIALIATYQLLRVLYVLLNTPLLTDTSWLQCIAGFVIGLRFDLATITTINVPLMALHSLRILRMPKTLRCWLDHVIGVAFLVLNLPLIAAGVIDARMYAFTGRRMTLDFFSIGDDIQRQSFSILIQYWWLTLLCFVIFWGLTKLTWQTNHERDDFAGYNLKHHVIRGFLITSAAVLAIRGGIQTKPLVPAHAYVYQPAAYANLILNSGLTLLRTPPIDSPKRIHDFADMQTVRATLTPTTTDFSERVPLSKGKNIVVLIVESLATEYVGSLNQGKGYTPFLDSLFGRSVVFQKSFANGRRSIDAMPAIFAGVPAWREQPFVTSPFSGNQIQALPNILRDQGYTSFFFHGAANGSMHFDTFSAMAGFDHYIGQDEYPRREDQDGAWGVFDEPFLGFAADTLQKTKEPFFAGIFTLSSHNPFPIPDQYKNKFPKGTLPIHESIGYTDHALKQFFAKAETMPWYANTIFVITGDHTSLSNQPAYDQVIGRYEVPIVFFDPTSSLPNVGRGKIAQHTDIAPTLLDLMGLTPDTPNLFGWSLFDPAYQGRFIQQEYGNWYYYDQEYLVRITEAGSTQVFQPDDLKMTIDISSRLSTEAQSRITQLKAARQYFFNGLLDNNWVKSTSAPQP